MNTIKVRTTVPKKSDKFGKCYIKKASGGWSNCITGKPKDKECDVLANCVGYANGRFAEIYDEIKGITGIKYPIKCNAENFIEKAKGYGLEISQVPSPGAIGVLQKGETLKKEDGCGHVFIVEYPLDLNPKCYKVFTSESGYNTTRGVSAWNATRSNENGRYGSGSKYKFRGFIVNPAVKFIKPATTTRNTAVNQIRTLTAMNVRLGIETNKESIAYVPTGTVFNYYEKKNGKSSVWYAVDKDKTQWVAGKSLSGDKKYVEELPATKPTPTPTQKFKIGDKVIINGPLYRTASAASPSGKVKNKTTVITRYAAGAKHPYNTKGDLGWMDESSIKKA